MPGMPIDEDPFQWLKPSDAAVPVIEGLRTAYRLLHTQIERTVPNSRERSVAMTYLESSAMWAVKAAVGRIE